MTLQYKLPELKGYGGIRSSLAYDMSDLLDVGVDSDWRTEKARLRSIGIIMRIHHNARYRDRGVDHFLKFTGSYLMQDRWGECRLDYNEVSGLFEVEIVRMDGLDKNKTEFIRGHEEAHAMILLGQLTGLYEEAHRLGLSFDFLSQLDSQISDESVTRLMYHRGTKKDAEIAWRKEFSVKESIANVGGLVALIKSQADPGLISTVRTEIQRMKRDPYPA